MRRLAIVLSTALCFGACGSSDDDNNSGGSCDIEDDEGLNATSITKQPSSGAMCPEISPDQINGMDDADAGSDPCDPVFDKSACTAKIACTDADGAKISGSFKKANGKVTGTLKIVIPVDTGDVTCSYDLVGE